MTTELKKKFNFIFQVSIVLKSLILLFVHPSALSGSLHDSLNRTSVYYYYYYELYSHLTGNDVSDGNKRNVEGSELG